MCKRLRRAWTPIRSRKYFHWREAQQQALRYQAREIIRLNDKLKEAALLALAAEDASDKRISKLMLDLMFLPR